MSFELVECFCLNMGDGSGRAWQTTNINIIKMIYPNPLLHGDSDDLEEDKR